MQDQNTPTVVEKIQVLFGAPRFNEDDIIDFINDQHLKLITRSQALRLCQNLLNEFNPLNNLKEHIDWVSYDFIESNII